MDNNETEAFLAHYGIKGMKWGVRRSDAQLARASGSKKSGDAEASEKPKRRINKKHVAVAAGVLGVVGAVAVTAVVANNRHQAGQASVMAQMKKMGGESTWDVLTKVNTSPTPKTPTKMTSLELDAKVTALKKKVGEDAVRQQIRDYSKQSMWDIINDSPKQAPSPAAAPAERRSGIRTPAQKRRDGEAAAKEQIKAFASRSMWDLAADTSLSPPKKSSYSSREQKNDTKLYGAKNAARIAKQVDKGVPLAEARQRAALRTYGGTAARVAVNVGVAKQKDKRRR